MNYSDLKHPDSRRLYDQVMTLLLNMEAAPYIPLSISDGITAITDRMEGVEETIINWELFGHKGRQP